MSEEGDLLTVTGEGLELAVSRSTGLIRHFRTGDRDLLLEGPAPEFWRPPTDNDFGGRWQERLGVWKDAGKSMAVEDVRVLEHRGPVVTIQVTGRVPVGDSRIVLRYTVHGDGLVEVEEEFRPGMDPAAENAPPRMPRFGMRMSLPGDLDQAEWFGLGPHESYWDRKTGVRVGRYRAPVSDLYFPYVRPQENGNRADTRWMALTRADGSGLLVVGDPVAEVTALHYFPEDLDPGMEKAQRHAGELRARDLVSLTVDLRQMGVGGINSWGTTGLEEYSLPFGPYRYRYLLRPIPPGDHDRAELARDARARGGTRAPAMEDDRP